MADKILGSKLKNQTDKLLVITELICCFYGCPTLSKKPPSQLYPNLRLACPGVPDNTHMTGLNHIDLCMPKHKQKTKFISKLILEIFIANLFSITLGMSDHTLLKWLNLTVTSVVPLTHAKNNFTAQLILEMKPTHNLA